MIITNDIEKTSYRNAEKFAIFSEKLKVKDSKLGVLSAQLFWKKYFFQFRL